MQTCNKNTGGTCMLSAGAWMAAEQAAQTASALADDVPVPGLPAGLTAAAEAGGKALVTTERVAEHSEHAAVGWFKRLVHLGEGAGNEAAEGTVVAKSNKVAKKIKKAKKGGAEKIMKAKKGGAKKIMKAKKGGAEKIMKAKKGGAKKIMKAKKGGAEKIMKAKKGGAKKIMKAKKGGAEKIMKAKKVAEKIMKAKNGGAEKIMKAKKVAEKIMKAKQGITAVMPAGGTVLEKEKDVKARVNDAVNSSQGIASLHGYRPKAAPDPDLFGEGSNCDGYRDAICTTVVAPLPGDIGKAAEVVDQTTNFLWHGIKSTMCMCRPTDCTVYSQKHSGLVCIYGPLLTMASEVIQDVEDPSFEHVTSFAYNGLSTALRGYGLDDPTSFMETNRHMLRQFADHQECLQQISAGGIPDDECKAFVCSFANATCPTFMRFVSIEAIGELVCC